MKKLLSYSEDQTLEIGRQVGASLNKNRVVCLFGDLGAGKTTLVKGIAKGAANYSSEGVNSPTFTYLNIYEGTTSIYHFDLYRIKDSQEFIEMGFDEFFSEEGICCIEWSERIEEILPKNFLAIEMKNCGETAREIFIK